MLPDLVRTGRSLLPLTCGLALLLLFSTSAAAQAKKLELGWQLLADRAGALTASDLASAQGWRDVRVGLSWNAQFDDLRDYMGVAWYRTRFEAPPPTASTRVFVRFGAVDYFSEVFVNGKPVGTHEGGYTPFRFDITEVVKAGTNELAVRVIDPPMDEKENRARFPAMLYNEIPHGKQNWYVQTGGIWQPVWLEIKPRHYLDQVQVTPRISGDFSIGVQFGGGSEAGRPPVLRLTVRDPGGAVVFTKTEAVAAANQTIVGSIPSPRLWSPGSPSLYTVEAALVGSGGRPLDSLTDRFGFRQFEARDGKFYLNGEPFYMIAALDQDFYPEGIYTPPSKEYMRDMMMKGKRLGLNLLRCHIKVPDPAYLEVADEVGMLVWYEIPSWNDANHFSPRAAERGETIFAEMVARDWNHPSIVIQTVINESWGADLKQEDQRRWLRAAFERAKKLVAPLGRLVVDNSPCCTNFHLKTDIDDFHQYYSIPDNQAKWDRWVADFAARPSWSFSAHGDGERTGREPLVVSEFGNWGLPKLPAQLPWWFARDFGGREVTRPAGVSDRFTQFQFGRLFKDYDALAEATQWHQFISLKHEIEEIRRHASIQGYVITEFTDINWEANGLLDMWRNPKVYADELAKIQQADVILARLPKRNVMGGESITIETLLSHYSAKAVNGTRLEWMTDSGARGQFEIGRAIGRGTVESLQAISFVAPQVDRPRRVRLLLRVRRGDGSLVAENSYEVFVFPKPRSAAEVSLVFHDPAGASPRLYNGLQAAGYKVSTAGASVDEKSLLIATKFDDRADRHTRAGGRAIILADAKEALPEQGRLKAVPRAGSDLDGNWVTNFNWAKPDAAPFADVAITKVLGFESISTAARHVLQGLRGDEYGDVLAGIFYGWLNKNAALAVQLRSGAGGLFVTTLRFEDYGSDPYATRLLDAIIRHVSGQDFRPAINWP